MYLLYALNLLSVIGASLLFGLGLIKKRKGHSFFNSPLTHAGFASIFVGIQFLFSIYVFQPFGNEVLLHYWTQDIFFFCSLWIWLPLQLGLHWLLTVHSFLKGGSAYHQGLLLLCGSVVISSTALNTTLLILPAATLLLSLALPLIIKPHHNTNSAEAALKTLLELRYVLLFWALSITVGYGQMGTIDLDIWLKHYQSGFLPASLALLMLAGMLFALIGIPPFHGNRVDLLTGGQPVGTLIIFMGHFIFVGSLICRLVNNSPLSGYSLISDSSLAVVCLLAFVISSLSALDQRTIDRLLAFMVLGNAPLLIPLVHSFTYNSNHEFLIQTMVGVFASMGLGCLLVYFAFMPLSQKEKLPLTWETCSGIGLANPFLAFVFILGLATLAGFPGTLGFNCRIALSQSAFDQGGLYTGWAVLASIPLHGFAILRLASFLFFKKRTHAIELTFKPSLRVPCFILFVLTLVASFLFGLQ